MAKKESEEKELDPRTLLIANKLKAMRIEKGYTSYENFAIEKGYNACNIGVWKRELILPLKVFS